VRELRNLVEQAAVLASGPSIRLLDLPPLVAGESEQSRPSSGVTPSAAAESFAEAKRRSIEDFERNYIQAALRDSGGNISKAAHAMGLARQSLQQKIRELGLRAGADEDSDA
jgi:DNA-binding NtrC family response regulator